MAPIPPPPGFLSDEDTNSDFIPPPPGFDSVPPPPSFDTSTEDQGWLDWLGNAALAVPRKIGAGILNAEAGLTALAADRKSRLPDSFFTPPQDQPTDWSLMARGGYAPAPTRPEDDRRVVESARRTSQELNQSVDDGLDLDPQGLPKRLLDMTGVVAPALASGFVNPLLPPLVIGAQSVGQKYNALDQMPGLSFEQKQGDAFLTGGINSAASLIPFSILGKSTGNLPSRLVQEYLKQGGLNTLINPIQTTAEALVDSQVGGIPVSPEELRSRIGASVGDAWIMAAPFSVAGAMGAGKAKPLPTLDDVQFNQSLVEGPATRIGERSYIDQERPRSPLWDRSYLADRPIQSDLPLADGQSLPPPPSDAPPPSGGGAPDGFSVLDPLVKPSPDTSGQDPVPFEAPIEGFRSFDPLNAKQPAKTEVIKAPTEAETFSESPVVIAQEAARPAADPVDAPTVKAEEAKPSVQESQPSAGEPSQPVDLNTVEVPVKDLQLSMDVPQFKRGANARGVVEPLQGDYDRRGVAPIAVWKRKDGRLEVISGRHRFDLAQRTGEKTIPAQVYDEAKGFSIDDATTLDAELNIRDQNAKVFDMANYFRRIKVDPAEAEKRGMLSREDQRQGYDIGTKATDDTYRLYENQKLTDREAALISRTAPGDATLQATGAKAALRKEPLDFIKARMRVATNADRIPAAKQSGLFEGIESVERVERLQDAEANVIVRMQRALSERLNTIKGAAKRPEIAKQEGLPPDDPIALAQRVKDLEREKAILEDIHLFPEQHNKITEQAIRDLNGGTAEKDAISRSIEAKTGEVAINGQRGAVDPFWYINIFRGSPKDPTHTAMSESNQDYGTGLRAFWKKKLEFMDTTMRKAPQSERYIKTWWTQPQHEQAIIYDLSLTLRPYMDGISKQERATVDNYLAWARLKGKDGYRISQLAAERAGLNPQQAKAAVAVSDAMNQSLNILERRAIESAQHDHDMRLKGITTNEGKLTAEADLAQHLKDISQQFNDLRGYNYVPFSRFGKAHVKIVGANDETLYRAEFDKVDGKLRAAKAHLNQLVKDPNNPFYGGKVESGENPPPKLRQYDGVSQDLLNLLNSPGDGTPIQGFSKHFKNAALIPGQSKDMSRNIADYVLGLAKMVSMQHADQVSQRALLEDLHPIDDRNLARKLTEWSGNFKEPKNWKKTHALFNLGYIWGNFRVPFSDLIGRATLQYPLLGKYTGVARSQVVAVKGLAKEAAWWTHPKLVGKDLSAAIEDAQRRGIIPTDVRKKMSKQAQGEQPFVSKALRTAYDAGFKLKELTEASSRVGAFIWGWDAYPIWKAKQGKGSPLSRQEFAEQFVREGQAVPSQLELPPNAVYKSDLGRLSTKFRGFQIKIAKTLLENAGSPAFITNFLLASFLATGVKGLPGYRDFANLVYDPEKDLRKGGARTAVMQGALSDAMGVDMSGTAGYGEVVPTSGDALSRFILGVGGAPLQQLGKTKDELLRGHYLKAAASFPFMPGYIKEGLNVADWNNRGVVAADGTTLIQPEDITPGMAVRKFFGWNPIQVSDAQTSYKMVKKDIERDDNRTIYHKRIGEALKLGQMGEAARLVRKAQSEGVVLNPASIETARKKAQGQLTNIPKDKRDEVAETLSLFK